MFFALSFIATLSQLLAIEYSRGLTQTDADWNKRRPFRGLQCAVGTVTAVVIAAVPTTNVVRSRKDESGSLQVVVKTFDQLRRRACVLRSSLLFFSDAREAFWTTAVTTFIDLHPRQTFTPAARGVLRATAKGFAADRANLLSYVIHAA